ncbi:group 1 glycosyl transferase [Haloferax volcanii JCM 10717]|uniref:Group 1 glycosyl transferase n=1 Tax=Haloferax volcanii JCM 10717 TaxID=1227458 RepID=M0HW04_HALVO|nr:group 1 glycosyl transferase [Haloferax alexandrinus JCM 10717]
MTEEIISHPEHEVVLFGSSTLAGEFDAEVFSTGFVDNQALGLVWERTVLPLLTQKAEVDVLYCPNGNGPLHEIDIPVVMCIHDVNAQKGMSSGVHQFYRKLVVPVSARACDKIVTVSEFSKREICSVLDISDDKVKVIYNGVSENYFEENSTAIDLPDEYLLFVGSLNPRKNIQGLLRAFKKIREERDIELVIIGPSNKDIFQNLELESFSGIHICGFVDELEVKYAYENAEVFVFPSFYEGFGLPPLEALACGTPIVVSDRSSMPEILGDCAVFVNPESSQEIASGIHSILDGEQTFDEDMLRSHAEKFTWESVRTNAISLFEEVNE